MALRDNIPEIWRGTFTSPMREMMQLQRRMTRVIEEMMEPMLQEELFRPSYEWIEFVPSCDVGETDTHYLISFDLPGVSKNEIKIELRDHQLMVSGERKEEREKKERAQVSRERSYGAFQRVVTLPLESVF